MSALEPILAYKADEVAALKRERTLAELEAQASEHEPPRGFGKALSAVAETDENALICELKRRSPSAGEILPGADPVAIASEYEAGGAACLSILTDKRSFGGTLDDLVAARARVSLPVLRKDFMIDPLQVAEARAFGADAILIIMAAVPDTIAAELESAAHSSGMDALIEVHNEAELDRALALKSPLIGVNNRDLTAMTTDLAVTERLAPRLPEGRVLISESGVATTSDIDRLRATGARRFLIGENLMKASNRSDLVHKLRTTQ